MNNIFLCKFSVYLRIVRTHIKFVDGFAIYLNLSVNMKINEEKDIDGIYRTYFNNCFYKMSIITVSNIYTYEKNNRVVFQPFLFFHQILGQISG